MPKQDKTKAEQHVDDSEVVTFIVKLPLSLRKTIKMLAVREGVTINEFFLRAAYKEVAEVVAKVKGQD